MPRLDTRPAPHVVPHGVSYFEYGRLLCTDVVVPWVGARIDLAVLDVADFGAHHGGMVDALRESGVVASAIGLEISEEVVASSPFVGDDRFRLEVADVTNREPDDPTFDLVVMHDVLEHIPDAENAVAAIAEAVRPGGHLFVAFPPYYSAFGGHQHLTSGRRRSVPFLHLLPTPVFLRVIRASENEYMSAESVREDVISVRRARLTLRKAERAFARAGLQLVDREHFVVRPEHTLRYGIKTRGAGPLGRLPLLREFIVNGAFYLARRPG